MNAGKPYGHFLKWWPAPQHPKMGAFYWENHPGSWGPHHFRKPPYGEVGQNDWYPKMVLVSKTKNVQSFVGHLSHSHMAKWVKKHRII